ncbi:heavy-metal-associated domain-containing protein [Calidifontibacillus erzurumensis]|uniref:Heavy-metal-associated domain-containing protein n=1 Tax=Calidifontibacillus erzurumensis TaxID=2741433 RepID=A0A8J8GK12_9BACI|nr:cation transporter [Calidifontibacillus erzurumensis]NSL53203.1 heavy-metal-associated domain-containing protein [Calidifontibacillus erzurumensis]
MKRLTMYVLGISCLKCIHLIEEELINLSGIFSFKGLLPKGKIVIEFNPSLVSVTKIIDQIENKGFAVLKTIQKEDRELLFD